MGRLNTQLLITTLLAFSWQGSALADDDHDKALSLKETGQILPLEEILQQARNHLDGRILEVELEKEKGKMIYELHLLDKSGVVWELEMDASNGKLIKKELEQ